jgi:SAM-dependent methyltransferase
MEFYQDAIRSLQPGDLPLGAHVHTWTPQSIAELWTIWANNRILRSQFYPRRYYEALLDEAAPHVAGARTIADIGCGTGTVLSLLRARGVGRQLIGVDVSDASLAALREQFAGDGACDFRVGSIVATGLESGSCDLVICTETLEHLFPGDFAAGLAEVARVLRPGGALLASVPLEERPNFVACPECHAIFTPYQHMLFHITIAGLTDALGRLGMDIVHVIDPIDTGVPRRAWKRFLKDHVLRRFFPGLTRRLFRVAGVSGFVARRRSA